MVLLGLAGFDSAGDSKIQSRIISMRLPYVMPDDSYEYTYLPRKDTVFISGDEYIAICLKSQITTLVRRNDSDLVFPVSSGTDNIHKGIKTTTGIFTVQSKIRLGISRQFNNAELINWIGFNGNIGFHGLRGNGYYHYLGKRPSSHGCVRISRKDGDTLYGYVKVGTPVIVFEETPARIIAFYDEKLQKNQHLKILADNPQEKNYLNNRLENLYSGFANRDFGINLLLEQGTVLKKLKVPVGESSKIAGKQFFIGGKIKYHSERKDNTKIYQIFDNKVLTENL